MGGLWTYYTWYYKEILIPRTAPVNLTTQVAIEEAGYGTSGKSNTQLEAIRLSVTATNASTRTIYFAPNYWTAEGMNISVLPGDESWLADVNKTIEYDPQNLKTPSPEEMNIHGVVQLRAPVENQGRYYEITKIELIAFNDVFEYNVFLHPKETISRSFLFYVPVGAYDFLNVHAYIPTTAKPNSVAEFYHVNPDRSIDEAIYVLGKDGSYIKKETQVDVDVYDPSIQLQTAEAWQQLSLWQSSASRAGRQRTSP